MDDNRTLTASDGQTLAYRIMGSGPRLVCLPGGPGRAATYLDDLGGLDRDHQLVLLDTRGSGGSRPVEPDTLTIDRLVADVAELCAALEEDRPILLAHSFGCRIAAEFAHAHPGAARGLVLLTAPPLGESEAVTQGREAIVARREGDPAYAEAVEAARALPDARPRDRAMLEQLVTPLWWATWDERAAAYTARAADETPARTALTLRNAAVSVPPPDLTALAVPMLLVAGEYDHASPPNALRHLHERIPGSEYVEIADAGHYPWVEQPAALRDAVAAFVARLLDAADGAA